MPGVVITTGTVSGPSAPTLAPASTYFVVGLAERGPTDAPVLVQSYAQFQTAFGDPVPYSLLHPDLRTFFAEGGTRAYVTRVVGPAAAAGDISTGLMDRGETPEVTINVAARSAGAWSERVSVQVVDGATSGTFRLRVFFDGVLARDYTNLRSPAEAVARTSSDPYIVLTDAGSEAEAPDNNPAANSSPISLSAGSDDRSSVSTDSYLGALGRFDAGLGDGAVAIPGVGTAGHSGLIAHADSHNRIALLAHSREADIPTLIDTAAALDARRAGLFAPWVRIPDEYGGTRTISPEGYVAAARARAHLTGPWQAAAGVSSRARLVVGPDVVYSPEQGDELDDAKVSVIRTIAGSTRLYGWRSLSEDVENWAYLTGADVINRIVTEAYLRLEPYLFGVIDARGHLLAQIEGTLTGIVMPMADAGGLFARFAEDGETLEDPGYVVNVSGELNPTASLAQNQVLAELGVRVAPTAAWVRLTVTKAAVTAAL